MGCDFAILTIVPEAYEAVREVFGLKESELRGGQRYLIGRVPAGGGGEHTVVLDRAVDRSNLPACEAVQRTLVQWRRRCLLVADIGGGFHARDGLKLGDVVFGSYLHYYELKKETRGRGEETRNFAFAQPSRGPRALCAFISVNERSWKESIPIARPHDDSGVPALLEGEIVSGDRLLSNPVSEIVIQLGCDYPKALAVDMESAGAARAIYGAQQDEIYTQFAVLRGISDIVDAAEENNQRTRDDWKPYASWAAAAAALALVRATPAHVRAEADLPQAVRTYRAAFQKSLTRRLPDQPQMFALQLHSAPRGAAPTGRAPETLKRDDLLRVLDEERRVVLYGPSGAGKSWALMQVARQVAAGDNPLPILVDLKAFKPELIKQIAASPFGEALEPAIDAILSASVEPISAAQVGELVSERCVMLLVDGINEVPDVGERMLAALNEYYRQKSGRLLLLVTDRRPQIFYSEESWKLVECRGLSGQDAQAVVDGRFGPGTFGALDAADRELLALPFFLDWTLKGDSARLAPRATAVERFLRNAGLSDDDLRRAAKTAFDVYLAHSSLFGELELSELGADGLLDRLHQVGVAVHRGMNQSFSHQIFHQFLAAYWMASREEQWTTRSLDAVTANAASPDTVAMTLTLIKDIEARDRLLRIVYDWNWRAAVSALRETQAAGRAISEAMEAAILSMAAEKLFDPVEGTAQHVRGQLGQFPVGGLAAELRGAADHPTLLAYVERLGINGPAWFDDWTRVFLRRPPKDTLTEDDIVRTTSDEPLLGWTTANTIRRFDSDPVRSGQLRALYLAYRRGVSDSRADTVRWRIVHALGRWPTADNAMLLGLAPFRRTPELSCCAAIPVSILVVNGTHHVDG